MPFDKVAWHKAYDQKRRLDPEVRARHAEMTRLWLERNPGHKAWQKAYNQKYLLDPKNRAHKAERDRLWRKRNPGGQNAYNQKRRLDPEYRKREAEEYKLWRDKNPGHKAAYKARRRKNDPAYRILENCRGRLRQALKGRGTKSARTLELLGCSPQQLKLHLEAQFRPDMTWENYGTLWQIDHIFPCARFDLSCPIQQRQCFHFSNLQPLEARENNLKRDN